MKKEVYTLKANSLSEEDKEFILRKISRGYILVMFAKDGEDYCRLVNAKTEIEGILTPNNIKSELFKCLQNNDCAGFTDASLDACKNNPIILNAIHRALMDCKVVTAKRKYYMGLVYQHGYLSFVEVVNIDPVVWE